MAYQVMTGRFIGRTQELAWLRERLGRATTGEPQVALIGGEAGVGKTRLTEQLASTASEQGVRVLRGGCVPLGEEGVPFAPVTEALRGLARELDPAELAAITGPARPDLARLLPELAGTNEAAVAAGAAGASQASQGRLFALLLGVVERLATGTPLLWVMEDLHWADRSTRELVAFLVASLRTGRVVLVCTFRGDELHRRHPLRGLLAELGRNRRVQRLELRRFTRAELTQQLTALLGVDPPARLADDIYARSEGNPFFTEELVLAGGGDTAGPGALPPSLQEVLLARVVRLGRGTQRVLGVAAAAGPGVTQPVLAAVTGMGEAGLLDSLHEAVDHHVLLPEPDGDGYVFRHALVAEAVYGELLPGERVGLHTALAGVLEAGVDTGGTPATRAARLAHHWSAAGDQPRALAASLEAAAAAERVYAFAEAQLQLERVLGLWERVPDAAARAGTDHVGLLSRCAQAADTAGDTARATHLVRQALALVDGIRQPRRAGLLHEQLARCLRTLGDPDALDEQQQAVSLVPPEPSVERARVLGSLAVYLEVVDRFADAKAAAEEAVAIAGQVEADAEEASARTALGYALAHLGDPDAGIAELQTARRLATQAGDPASLLRAIGDHADVLLAAGRLEQAASAALDAIQQARRLGQARQSRAAGSVKDATAALLALGRWDQADQVSREGLETIPFGADSVDVPLARAALELALGELDAAELRLRTARRLLPDPIPEPQQGGPLFCGLAELALWRSELNHARALVAEAVPLVAASPRRAAPLYALGLRVEADRAELARARRPGEVAGDDGTGAALLERLHEAATGLAAAGIPELAAWHLLGRAERTRQHGRPDPAAWAAAATVWERLGQPYRVAYAGFRQAEALLAGAGDRDAAATALRRAADITGRLGARLLDGEVKALARRGRLQLDSPTTPAAEAPTPTDQLGLTPREAEVLALVAAGRSNRQIAQALFISPKTASVHVSNILTKLGVSARVEAAAVAHRLGLDAAEPRSPRSGKPTPQEGRR
jgi:DNA-binding CsgD family transcriptional regulator